MKDERAFEDLEGPGLPEECRHLWYIFMDLHARRGNNGFGPNPLTYGELTAWQIVHRTTLDTLEVQLLFMADTTYLIEYARQNAPKDRPVPPEDDE